MAAMDLPPSESESESEAGEEGSGDQQVHEPAHYAATSPQASAAADEQASQVKGRSEAPLFTDPGGATAAEQYGDQDRDAHLAAALKGTRIDSI